MNVSRIAQKSREKMISLLSVAVLLFVSLHAGNAERFLEEPEDATVSRGHQHLLRCTVEDRQGEVQWLRNGFGLGPGVEFEGFPRYRILQNDMLGEFHLMLSDIGLDDDALFECQVGATVNTPGLVSRKAQLTVQVPPDSVAIGDGSATTDVVAGKRHTLTCRAVGGKPAPTMTWESPRGQPVSAELRSSTEYIVTVQADGLREDAASRLSLVPSKSDEGREFACHAINTAMSESKWAKTQLRVLYEPELKMTVTPNSEHLRERQSFQLSCSSVANPDTVTWRWLLDGIELPDERSSTLYIPSLGHEHHGKELACEARNSVGNTRLAFPLSVEYGPRFVVEPLSQAADVGDDVLLTCEVIGNPLPTIYWRRRDGNEILGTQTSLYLSGLSEEQFTTYTCTASSTGYSSVSRELHVVHKGRPTIVSETEQSARYGETGEVECLVRSIPAPEHITWMKNGQDIDFLDSSRYHLREETVPFGIRSVLQIFAVQDSDFAEFNCSAHNPYGSTHMAIVFSKRELVPLPYILAGVGAGVLLIIIITVTIIIFHRCRSRPSTESDSRTSDDSVDVKKSSQIAPDIKVEYSTNTVDDWQRDLLVPPRYTSPRPQSEYDELRYPLRDPMAPSPRHDVPDYAAAPNGYGYAHNPDPYARPIGNSIYGTYPRGIGHPQDPRGPHGHYGPLYGSDTYATVTRPRNDFWPPPPPTDMRSPPALSPPPAIDLRLSPTDSRLSTNV